MATKFIRSVMKQMCFFTMAILLVSGLFSCTKEDAPKLSNFTLSASDSLVINKVRQGLLRGAELCDKISAGAFTAEERSAYLNEVRVIHKLSKAYLEKFTAKQGNTPMVDSLKNLFDQFEKTAAKSHIAVDSVSQQ